MFMSSLNSVNSLIKIYDDFKNLHVLGSSGQLSSRNTSIGLWVKGRLPVLGICVVFGFMIWLVDFLRLCLM